MQVPKLWNAGGCSRSAWRKHIANEYQGACNIALLSYVHRDMSVPVSATKWSDILAAGLQTLMTCLISQNQGGAAVVNSKLHPNVYRSELCASLTVGVFPKAFETSLRFQFLCGRMERNLTR